MDLSTLVESENILTLDRDNLTLILLAIRTILVGLELEKALDGLLVLSGGFVVAWSPRHCGLHFCRSPSLEFLAYSLISSSVKIARERKWVTVVESAAMEAR